MTKCSRLLLGLLAQSYFMPFALTLLSLLARFHLLQKRILLAACYVLRDHLTLNAPPTASTSSVTTAHYCPLLDAKHLSALIHALLANTEYNFIVRSDPELYGPAEPFGRYFD
jgi:hypothetical protein